jgi:nitroreductase
MSTSGFVWSDTFGDRYSARRFDSGRVVEDVLVEEICLAALQAPSSKDDQPWRWHVVRSVRDRARIADAMAAAPGRERYVPTSPADDAHATHTSSVAASAEVLREAPVALFLENLGGFSGGRDNIATHPETAASALVAYTFEVIGLGASVQNALLAAHGSGLGAVFIGDVLIAEGLVADLLGLTGDLAGVVCLGYASAPRFAPKELRPGRLVRHR